MRIVAWSILQGAPKRATQVGNAMVAHHPDLVVLSEFHPARSRMVAEALNAARLKHHASAPAGLATRCSLLPAPLCKDVAEAVLLRHYQQPDEATLLRVVTGRMALRELRA